MASLAVHGATTSARDYLREGDLTPSQAKRLAAIESVTRPLRPSDYRKLLYARCDPMFLDILIHGEKEARRIGLNKKDLTHTIEGRLRAARLFVVHGYQSLTINITLNESPEEFGLMHASVSLMRLVDDIGVGMDGVVRIWGTGMFGGYTKAGTIIEAVSRSTDEFITKYLRANDGVCQMRWSVQ
ncbi:MAG: hypothetical protein OYH76_18730 [Defluviicoccus sp.]|nr:hypothetical protein [Defluviicoccus sp.]MDE0277934.1 hypothetical protein [Defluviicoccus sp.]